MIPLRDTIPRVHRPVMVLTIIALNLLAFGYEMSLAEPARELFFHLYGVVPARYLDPAWAAAAGYPGFPLLPPFTYMFLHSGLLHVGLNLWMLWIFADNIEDVMGPGRFAVFYLLCGLIAVAVHVLFNPEGRIPIIGASGAVAGVMGAYFALYPQGKVLTFIPIIIIPFFINIPSVLFLGLWFGLQIVAGLAARSGGQTDIAWWAHAGGFTAGLLLIRFFKRPERCYYCWNPEARDYRRKAEGGPGGPTVS